GVAHDFNNLLTAILGYCNLILEELPKDHRLRSDLDEIRTAGERAAAVTRQLLAFSRRQMLQPQVVDLNELVGQLEKLLRRVTSDSIELSMVFADRLLPVRVDPSSIAQVIINLAMNGKDAMPHGGRLAIATANVEIEDTAEVRAAEDRPPPGSYVGLSVSDTGAGMDEETRRHVFEPFFTTKRHGHGLGLGLATVFGIVKQNGGYILVTSEAGRGSTFTVYLNPVQARTSALEPDRRAWQTVLLVEDDDAVRALAREVLRRDGYVVLEAKHAADAVRIAERHPDEIHVLVAGPTLPHLSGGELARRLADRWPRLKKIFLLKPFAPDALTSELRSVLATSE
ncbi:MAG TPA: ATP-binding protein, partial [Vicinamibacterales bacterium]|nr:ATP-binding protein [Vicinamibacterales bacterium]